MRRLLLFAIFLLALLPREAVAQANVALYCPTGGQPLGWAPCSSGNPLSVSASVSASVTGFAPATTGTPISVTTGGVTGTLPAGTVVVAFNTGATNTAFCKLGASATTSDIAIPPASWFSYTVGAATQLTCITSTSTTTVNMVGGSGLATGAGGGGGGSGGSVTQGTSPWVDNITQFGGTNISTGTGTGGAGIPRVTVSSDSSLTANPGTTTSTGTGWTSGTAGNTTQALMSSGGWPAILVQLNQTSTISGGAVTFEGTYDGSNWVSVPVAQLLNPNTLAPLTNPYTLVASTNQPFLILTQGYQQVRLRLSTTIAGSATVTPQIALLPYNPTIAGLLNPIVWPTTVPPVKIDQTTFGSTNGVVSAANTYQAVAASQTATVLQTSTGATGDYLSHCIIYPTSTSPGVVTVFDNTNTAANSAVLFAGGASSTSNLTPITVPVGAKSINGAWKVTTGAAVSVVCVGKFS